MKIENNFVANKKRNLLSIDKLLRLKERVNQKFEMFQFFDLHPKLNFK